MIPFAHELPRAGCRAGSPVNPFLRALLRLALVGCACLAAVVHAQSEAADEVILPEDAVTVVTEPAPTSSLGFDVNAVPLKFNVAQWNTDRGLPQDTVRAIMQARDGAIWVGTSEGVARFDGQNFTVFSAANTRGFVSGPVTALAEGADGTVWIGTENGLMRLRRGVAKRLSRKDGVAVTAITALLVDDEGSVWIGTSSGLNRIQAEAVSGWTEKDGLPGHGVHFIAKAPEGGVLVGTSDRLCRIQGHAVTIDPRELKLNSRHIRIVFTEAGGALWLVTNGDVLRSEGGKVRRFGPRDGIKATSVNALAQDGEGNVWLATNDGLLRFDGRSMISDRVEQLDAHEPVRTVFADREGSIWLGTNAGLTRLRRTTFSSLGSAEGLAQAAISAVCRDQTGALWVGTMDHGLMRLAGREVTTYGRSNGFPSDSVRSLRMAPDGTLSVGFDKSGLVAIRDGVVTRHTAIPETLKSGISHMLRDSRGTLWIGAGNGLWTVKDGKAKKHSGPGGFRYQVRAIVEDRHGIVWVATSKGLVRCEGDEFRLLRSEDGLSSSSLRSLYLDADDVLWIGHAASGLDWLRDGEFSHCSTQAGLPSETVLAMVDDALGNLWVCTPQGVSRVAKAQLEELRRGQRTRVDCATFGTSDGLRAKEVGAAGGPAAVRTPDGRLWFATAKGLATVDPARVPRNSVPPPVAIAHVAVNGVEMSQPNGFSVPPGASEVEIGYTALSFAQPDKVRFRYQLEGVNEKWVDAGARRVATFSRVPPGRRVFRVQAMNNDGVWSEHDATIEFNFAPYFYETAWFYVAAGATALVLAWLIHALRLRALHRRERKLVQLVNERTQHLEAQIAARQRAQEALERSESHYQSLVQILPLSLYRKDGAGRFTFANRHFCAEVGRSGEELIGKTDADIRRQQASTDDQVMATGQTLEAEEHVPDESGGKRWYHTLKVPVRNAGGEIVGIQGLAWDITARKRAEEQAAQVQGELVEVSRVAGRAEVATNILHNVGNVLNSVNVSVTLLADLVRSSKAANLGKVAQLLEDHAANASQFLSADARGKTIPGYLTKLAEHLEADRATILAELAQLRKHVEHIKAVVAMQQGLARVTGVTERVELADVIEDALSMNANSLARHGVEIVREYHQRAIAVTERHKVLQVLVNFLENAKHACAAVEGRPGRVVVRLEENCGMAAIRVIDNGVGIAPANLTRIFAHGFTTRKDGHGFGLHSAALIAKELGGRIEARSDGEGRGAEFALVMPVGGASRAT